jgi:hypothetical protein
MPGSFSSRILPKLRATRSSYKYLTLQKSQEVNTESYRVFRVKCKDFK